MKTLNYWQIILLLIPCRVNYFLDKGVENVVVGKIVKPKSKDADNSITMVDIGEETLNSNWCN